jgi:hypothetical protein
VQSVDRLSPMQTQINANTATLTPIADNIKPTDQTVLPSFGTFGTIFKDKNELIAGGIDSNLDWWFFSKLYTRGGESIDQSSDPNVLFQVNDKNGKVALRLSADGTTDFIPGVSGSSGGSSFLKTALGADIVHFILRGQSLWQGAQAQPIVTTSALGYGGLMFGGYGVLTWDAVNHPLDPENRPAEKFTLAPLVEQEVSASVNGGTGETIASGLVAQFNSMLLGHFTSRARGSGQQILLTFSDQGGRFLDEISKTPVVPDGIGAYYATFEDDVRRAQAAAAAQNKTYSAVLVDFGQGEANSAGQMTRGGPILTLDVFWPQYRDQLLQLRSDMSTSIQTITGKAAPTPLLTYQTEGITSGEAQLLAMDKAPTLVTMAGPHYDTPTALNSRWTVAGAVYHGLNVHRTADASRLIGCRHGKTIYRRLVLGEDDHTLRIASAKAGAGNTVVVQLSGGRGPIVIDTTWLPKQQGILSGWGFEIWSGFAPSTTQPGGTPAVTGIWVSGAREVTLQLSGALPATPMLRYGQQGTCAPLSLTLDSYVDGAGSIWGYATKELAFNGLIKSQALTLLDQGAFYLDNLTAPRNLIRAIIIRDVQETAGKTRFIAQVNEVTGGAAFVAGDQLQPRRDGAFGNIRDSDNEYCPLGYADTTYGTRATQGLKYPLWNWLAYTSDVGIN